MNSSILPSAFRWQPIQPLSDTDRKIDLAAMQPLYDSWQLSKSRLEQSSAGSLREFNQRLIRRLSVETGILERLYDLDRGTTEALIAHGFVEELVSASSTDIEPSRLVDILRDQEAAIQLVIDCVAGNRTLSKSVLHELHAILTRHQDTTVAVDQFGRRFEIPLLKGQFKRLPNNPKRPDGGVHEYCPPDQVEGEIDRLLDWLCDYVAEDPVITASWCHHRFTQIHPYQDGNGRVGRALTTLILIRANLLPLIIDRDLRIDYINGLEAADRGDLSVLASLFARLERAAILQALSIDLDAEVGHQKSLTAAVIESVAARLGHKRKVRDAELRKVNAVAIGLRTDTRRTIETVFGLLESRIGAFGSPDIHVSDGGPDRENAHWYKYEVIESANLSGKYANFDEDHYFIKASVRIDRERLVLVTSFHHIGRELSGIMEATVFARLESFEDSDERKRVSRDFFVCSLEPFVFTYRTKPEEIEEAFGKWLDASIAVAIKEFGDRL